MAPLRPDTLMKAAAGSDYPLEVRPLHDAKVDIERMLLLIHDELAPLLIDWRVCHLVCQDGEVSPVLLEMGFTRPVDVFMLTNVWPRLNEEMVKYAEALKACPEATWREYERQQYWGKHPWHGITPTHEMPPSDLDQVPHKPTAPLADYERYVHPLAHARREVDKMVLTTRQMLDPLLSDWTKCHLVAFPDIVAPVLLELGCTKAINPPRLDWRNLNNAMVEYVEALKTCPESLRREYELAKPLLMHSFGLASCAAPDASPPNRVHDVRPVT